MSLIWEAQVNYGTSHHLIASCNRERWGSSLLRKWISKGASQVLHLLMSVTSVFPSHSWKAEVLVWLIKAPCNLAHFNDFHRCSFRFTFPFTVRPGTPCFSEPWHLLFLLPQTGVALFLIRVFAQISPSQWGLSWPLSLKLQLPISVLCFIFYRVPTEYILSMELYIHCVPQEEFSKWCQWLLLWRTTGSRVRLKFTLFSLFPHSYLHYKKKKWLSLWHLPCPRHYVRPWGGETADSTCMARTLDGSLAEKQGTHTVLARERGSHKRGDSTDQGMQRH